MDMQTLAQEMANQDNRGTQYPIFIVVEDRKVYGMDRDYRDCGKERKEMDFIETEDLCDKCEKIYLETNELPEECENYNCEDSFVYYVIEKDVPNMRAGFFFTAKACEDHIAANHYHYQEPESYCISAWRNPEMVMVMQSIFNQAGLTIPPHYQ